MLRRLVLITAFGCMLVPATSRPPSAWADTTDAGVQAPPSDAGSAAPVVTVDPTTSTVTPAKDSPAAKVEADPAGTGKQILADVKSGNWRYAIAGILAVLFAIGVRTGVKIFGTTDRGKAISIMALALLGTLSAALATSTPLSFDLVGGAIGVALTAVGGRQWISRVLWPRDDGKPVAKWLQPWLGVKPGSDTGGGSGPAT
jgi:hypothetical protein